MAAVAETKIEARPSARRNFAWMLSGRVVQIVAAFGMGVLVTRYLGPEALGVLGAATAFSFLFNQFAAIGDQVVVRDLAQREEDAAEILGSQAAVAFVTSSIAYVVTVLAAIVFLDGSDGSRLMVAIMSSILLLAPLKALGYWFEATVQAKYVTLANTTATLVGALARLGIIVAGLGVQAIAVVVAAEQFLAIGIISVLYLRRARHVGRWRVRMHTARALVRESLPLLVSSLAIAVYMRIDQVMLGALSSRRETGLYTAVVRLSEAPNFVAMSLMITLAPGIAKLRNQDRAAYDKQISRVISLMGGLALLYAIPVAVLSTPIIALVLGSEYDGAGPVLAVHVLSSVFVFVGIGQSIWTVNESLQRWVMMRTVTGALLNIGLNFVLVPSYGALGASLSTLIAYAWTGWVGNLAVTATRPMFWLQLRAMDPRRLAGVAADELRRFRER